jgi:NADPH:quinone reductase-like Zn-dependent oxidoreductase
VTPAGSLVLVGGAGGKLLGPLGLALQAMLLSRFVKQHLVFFITRLNKPDLITLTELLTAGKVTPVIDRTYTLNEAPAAMSYLEAGHARGKVVITVP